MDDGYDSHESVLYWEFTYIKEWRQLKSKIPEINGGLSYGDSKINCLQALDWWVTDVMLRGNIIVINNFRTDIIDDDIDESRLDF